MIKTEYDSIDELVQDNPAVINRYTWAKEAHSLLMDSLRLSEFQKTMLQGSYGYLEDLLREQLAAKASKEPETVQIGDYVYRYDTGTYGETRGFTGQDIIDWIQKNGFENIAVYCGADRIFTRLMDEEDELHYRESYLHWSTKHAKYEVIENWLEKE